MKESTTYKSEAINNNLSYLSRAETPDSVTVLSFLFNYLKY